MPRELFFENVSDIDRIQSNLLGAFRVVFDLDRDEINDAALYEPYSKSLGIRSYGIAFDYRIPEKGDYVVSAYFPMLWKNNVYLVDLRIVYWNMIPSQEDLNNYAKGLGLRRYETEDKVKMVTAIGEVSMIERDWQTGAMDEVELGSVEPMPDGNFYHFYMDNGDYMKLAKRVKQIIEGRRNRGKDELAPVPVPSVERDLVEV